jgi:L-asparaginase II
VNESGDAGFEIVAVSDRSGCDESYHFGAVVVLERDGSIALSIGDPDMRIYPRSSNKPLQAVAMVRSGLTLPGPLLALVCASHSGTPRHLAGVDTILASAGLDAEALANTPDFPLDERAAREVVRAGGGRTTLQMNCSGKHAGMLATCCVNGWPTDARYLLASHPLQRAITEVIDELTDERHAHIGVDGCGAPAHVVSLVGLARAFRAIASGASGSAERAVADAIVDNPFEVGGPGRDVSVFIERVPGLIAKDGAQGVFAAALPDGRAVALKIAAGTNNVRSPVLAAALVALGVDVSGAESAWRVPSLGHGEPVGCTRPAGALAGLLPL